MTEVHKVWVNDTQMNLAFEFYRQDATLQLCRAKLMSTLLNGGIDVTQNGRRQSSDFKWVIERYWHRFLIDLFDAFNMFGFCVYSTKEVRVAMPSKRGLRLGKNKGGIAPTQALKIPYVRPHGSYRVQMQYADDAYVTYHLYTVARSVLASQMDEDRRLHILMSHDYVPTLQGLLRSKILPLLDSHRFVGRMKNFALKIEERRAEPPLLCEARPQPATNTDAVAVEMFGDADMYRTQEEASYAKNRMHMADLNRQKNMAAALNGKRPQDATKEIDPHTGRLRAVKRRKQCWEESVFVLPDGMTLSRPMNDQVRNDLVSLHDAHIDLVCATMGVPKNLLMNMEKAGAASGGTSGAAVDITYRLFMRNVEARAAALVNVLAEVYSVVYGGERAEFKFPFLPMLHTDDLIRLGELGLVSRQTLAKHFLGAVGLSHDEIALQGEAAVKLMTLPEHQKPEPAAPAKK